MSGLIESVVGVGQSGALTSVLKLATSVIGAYGSSQEAGAEAEAIKSKGAQELEQAKWQAGKLKKEQLRTGSRQRALYAASGVEISAGSPLEVMEDTRKEYEADILQTLKGGYQAYGMARTQAKNIKRAGRLRTGTTILSGLTEFAQNPLFQSKGGMATPSWWGKVKTNW